MSAILSFRLKLKKHIKKSDIQSLINQWLGESPYYDFEDTPVFPEEQESISTSDTPNNHVLLKHCEYHNPADQTDYLAFRIDNIDTGNLFWKADVIHSASPDKGNYVLIQLNRAIHNMEQTANCSVQIKLPGIINLLFENDMIDPEYQLPLNQILPIGQMTDGEQSILQSAICSDQRLELPILYMYSDDCSRHTDALKAGIPQLFSQVCHVYTAESEEENALWNTLSGDTDTHKRLVIWHPFIRLKNQLPLDTPMDDLQIYRYVIMMLQSCQECLTFTYPGWDSIYQLQNTAPTAETSSYYIRMTEELANRIQNQRKKQNITQGELADAIGVSKMLISRLERLQTIKVKRELIHSIETALNFPKDELLKPGVTGMKPPESAANETSFADAANLAGAKTNERNIVESKSIESNAAPSKEIERTAARPPRFCRKCGTPLTPDSIFCHWCGTKIAE